MKPIELKCYFTPDGEEHFQELGIKRTPLPQQSLRTLLFLKIDNIEPYIEYEVTYSLINSGANYYICHLSYEKLKEILLEAWNKEKL